VWVYCGDKDACGTQHQECWLKHLAHPDGAAPKARGPQVPWTSGMHLQSVEEEATDKTKPVDALKYHLVMSAQGFVTHWQSRVHYYFYKKIKKECEAHPPCHMGGFTRILHSGEPDDLMDEIPTIVVDPLPDRENKGYVVLNRPYAFSQWLREQKIREENILMVEPDHVILRPIPNMMKGGRPAAFPFFYIEPTKPEYVPITRKFVGPKSRSELEKIAPIGNSPTFIGLQDFRSMADTWMNITHAIFDDTEANKAWGWVLEMYGFTIAEYLAGIGRVSLHLNLMAQPPWDDKLKDFYILHFTYGQDFDPQGKFTPGKVGAWHWDKRDFMGKAIPRNLPLPPQGCTNELTIRLIESMNEATAAIPCWDEYVTTRRTHVKDAAGNCAPVQIDPHRRNTWANFPENQ
jgi:hydroxyproline O-arabinosyltransferase